MAELRRGIYIDDVLIGAKERSTAGTMYKEARKIFATSGMNLRKWTSNDPTLRSFFGEETGDSDKKE